jgi:hypothetical protein
MPYKSGTWGPDAKERSQRRLEYFHQYNQKRYEYDKEKILAGNMKYYRSHQEEILEKMKQQYEQNKEGYKARIIAYQKKHQEESKENMKRYYERHKEKILKARATAYQKKKEALKK